MNERTYAHDQKNNLYICALQRVDQVAYKHKKTVRYGYVSVDAASNRTSTFLVVPYVWICWENVYPVSEESALLLIDSFRSEIFISQSIYFNHQIDKYDCEQST